MLHASLNGARQKKREHDRKGEKGNERTQHDEQRVMARVASEIRQSMFPDRLRSSRSVSCAAIDIDSTLLFAVVLAGVIALLVFFPWDKL